MKSQESTVVSVKYKLILAILGLIGVGIILLATNRYGAGLSADSVSYIGTARNLISGAGFIRYDGAPLVKFPPLYPILLALAGGIFRTDPLLLANIVNALIFGLIVYMGGKLTFKHLPSFPALAFLGTLAILFSPCLFAVSVMAWSEPLFILFVLLSLLTIDSYVSKNDTKSLILLSSLAALSFLTRYVGVTLIFWGVLIIVIFHRGGLKRKIAHLLLFTLISALPMGIWIIRNYIVAGTLFGFSASSATLPQNLTFMFDSLVPWYIPGIITENRPILMFVSAAIVFFAGLSLKENWQSWKDALRQVSPTVLFSIINVLFIIIYTVFVVISATNTNVTIDSRMLSPIFVPLSLLILILAQKLVEPFRRRFSRIDINYILIICVAIWMVYPTENTMFNIVELTQRGQGYSGKSWEASKTIQYLLRHPTLESECTIYTNGYEVAYILAHVVAKAIPNKTVYNSPETAISSLRGVWPKEDKACLVWFNKESRTYLFTVDEIKRFANLDLIIQLGDGAIYSITRK